MKIISLKNKPEFTETVSHWIYKEFIENIRSGISYENVLASFKNRKTDSIPCTFIALIDNQCVGTVSLFESDLKKREDLTPWLGALYVLPDYRSQGIAKKLINKISNLTKSLGYKKLYLRTEHTADYYKKSGWTFVDKTIDEFNLNTEIYMINL